MPEFHLIYHYVVEAKDSEEAEREAAELAAADGIGDPEWVGVHPPEIIVRLESGVSTVEQEPFFVNVTVIDENNEVFRIVREWVVDAVGDILLMRADHVAAAESLANLIKYETVYAEDPLEMLIKRLANAKDVPDSIQNYYIDNIANELVEDYIV